MVAKPNRAVWARSAEGPFACSARAARSPRVVSLIRTALGGRGSRSGDGVAPDAERSEPPEHYSGDGERAITVSMIIGAADGDRGGLSGSEQTLVPSGDDTPQSRLGRSLDDSSMSPLSPHAGGIGCRRLTKMAERRSMTDGLRVAEIEGTKFVQLCASPLELGRRGRAATGLEHVGGTRDVRAALATEALRLPSGEQEHGHEAERQPGDVKREHGGRLSSSRHSFESRKGVVRGGGDDVVHGAELLSCDCEQELLLLLRGHPAWSVIDLVGELDSVAFYPARRATGTGERRAIRQ